MILVPSGGAARLLRRRGFENLAWLSPSMGHAGAGVDRARIHEQASPPLEFRCFAGKIAPKWRCGCWNRARRSRFPTAPRGDGDA